MLRHGYLKSPIHWREVDRGDLHGLWIAEVESSDPDIVVYYAHGGGFSMGSTYFYLEFLTVWLTLLKRAGFQRPAIFALEYTLVGTLPKDACYPTQLNQAIAGYEYVLSMVRDSSKICVGGDSAGATLILSLLLYLGKTGQEKHPRGAKESDMPTMAVLISPWTTLTSSLYKNTRSDFLNVSNLDRYAHQYAGYDSTLSVTNHSVSIKDPLVSPGNCTSTSWWRNAAPSKGFFVAYGEEEVFAPEIQKFAGLLRKAGVVATTSRTKGGIHAWPVASLFLSQADEDRHRGLRAIVAETSNRMQNC
ncbi:hypothetical protein BP6252_12731 [Coleophoma cylindrospora]|uniref:Alpha/beta hydrolase fold-3 domain-containing protein n=1 Tax=Coleophoma cylindrospora TaxID=1849047 RepID=A0A3D8QDY8_9HELO|nr:hypothetical protein BP6252_12731 [Coleophoma cylindrospora]